MITGVILAGGKSTRMGADKALVELDGVPLASHVAGTLRSFLTTVVIVGRESPIGDLDVLPDRSSGISGPLRGLATALASVKATSVFLVAVDQPFMSPDTLKRLAGLASPDRAVVPVADGYRQVTTALYPTSWAREAEQEADLQGSIQTLLDRMPHRTVGPDEWQSWGEDGRSWFSVDTPQALAEGIALYRTGSSDE